MCGSRAPSLHFTSFFHRRDRGRSVGVDQTTTRVGLAGLQAILERLQQSGEHVVVGNLLSEEETLHGVVVGEQGHHILEQEALAELQQSIGVIDLEEQADQNLRLIAIFTISHPTLA